jgi:hypothetical protein
MEDSARLSWICRTTGGSIGSENHTEIPTTLPFVSQLILQAHRLLNAAVQTAEVALQRNRRRRWHCCCDCWPMKAMKAYGGVNVYIHVFLTWSLVGGEWSPSRFCHFTPGTHWIGGCVDPRADLDDVEKRKFLTLPGLELRPLGRPARSQSLYRLHYPGSLVVTVIIIIIIIIRYHELVVLQVLATI